MNSSIIISFGSLFVTLFDMSIATAKKEKIKDKYQNQTILKLKIDLKYEIKCISIITRCQ